MSYASGDSEAKSTRERCIRVAAITIMIKLGVSNNCDIGRNEEQGHQSLITMKRTVYNGSNIWKRVELNGQLS